MRITRKVLATGVLLLAPVGAAAQEASAFQIVHAPPACLKPGAPAVIRARIQPVSDLFSSGTPEVPDLALRFTVTP